MKFNIIIKLFTYINKIDRSFEIFDFFYKRRKIQFFIIACLAIVAALFESFSIGLLIPMVSLITNNSKNNDFIDLVEKFNLTNIDSSRLIFYFFIFVIIIGSLIKILYSFLQARFGSLIVQEFNKNIFRNAILKPYQDFIDMDSSYYISAILNKSSFISRYLSNLLIFLVNFLTFICVFTALIIINLKLTIYIFLLVFLFYWLISILIKKRVKIISILTSKLTTDELQILNEADGLHKEILLNNNFNIFLKKFQSIDSKLRNKTAEASYLTSFPRYLLEALILLFGAFSIFLLAENNNLDLTLIPLLAAFLLGIQKLMPTVQSIYASWVNHKTLESGILEIISLMKDFSEYSTKYLYENKNLNKFNNFKILKLSNITFSYIREKRLILKDLSIKIKAGEFIGIVGSSGEGKSTLLNLLCGLNKPLKGLFLIDEEEVFKNFHNLKSWRNQVSYVSQNIYLTPYSIVSNITLREDNSFDKERLDYAIKTAQLERFIKSLKDGIYSKVGDKAMQISGGQKQRIGIARALYQKKNFLILDEATSSLDKKNEEKIISHLFNKSDIKQTIILVSHKINILRNCNKIFYLKNGVIFEKSFYDLEK